MSDINKKRVGERIKLIRQSKGMNLEEFGKLFSVSKSNVSKWESGANLPNNERLQIIAKLNDDTVEALLYGKPISFQNFKHKIYNNDQEIYGVISKQIYNILLDSIEKAEEDYEVDELYNWIRMFQVEENKTLENLTQDMVSLIQNKELSFYLEGAYIIYTEDINKLTTKIYLINYISDLLIQVSLNYPKTYLKHLEIIIENTKEEIKKASFERSVFKEDQIFEKLTDSISVDQYHSLHQDLDNIIQRIHDYSNFIN